MSKQLLLSVVIVIATVAAPAAFGGSVLQVVETAGDYYTITAVNDGDSSIQYWQCKVDVASGCIFSFVDFTDTSGGATDYMGTNSGYNRGCSLLQFYGRGGSVGTRSSSVVGLADHLTFAVAPDGSAFAITYAEDAAMTDFFQDAYGSVVAGDLLTTIIVTIRPPNATHTAWDWSVAQQNVSAAAADSRVWAKQEVRSYTVNTIPKTLDSEASDVNGPWNPAAPVSFGRFTVDANALGLTAGREFIIDYVSDVESYALGNSAATSSWAGFDYLQYKAAYSSPPAGTLAAGATRTDQGQLIINIPAGAAPGTPTAHAGVDQTVNDDDGDGSADVTLDGSGSTDADGTIVSYAWDEGGSPLATGVSPTVALTVGVHTLKLTVTDNDTLTDTDTVDVTVIDPNANVPPTADAGPDQNVTDPEDNGVENVTLDGSGSTDSDGTIASYSWVRGGLEVATGVGPTVPMAVGAHTVTLTVTDDDGDTGSDTVTITVVAPNPGLLNLPQPDPDCGLPESVPADTTGTQLYNTYGQTITGTRPTELVWPAAEGEAHLCMYADDKFAAASVTIDDMNRPDHDWWLAQAALHDIKLTWFIIPEHLADYRGTSNTATMYGYWSTFVNLYTLGHEVQSHSVTHVSNQAAMTACELHYEYGVSQQLIEQYIPGNACTTMAYAWGSGRETVAAQYYTAVRGVIGGTNIPFQTNYMNTRCAGTNMRPATDVILTGSGDLSWSNTIYKRGWAVFLYHGVSSMYTSLAGDLSYMMSFRDQIWVDTFNTISTYGQQRDTATLTVTAASAAGVTFSLTDRMMDSIYNLPLTVKVRMFDGWTDVAATQNGSPVEVTVVDHDGAKYALVKAVPDQGDVTLAPAAAGTPGDCDGDGDVDLDDFVILKTNFGRTDVTAGAAEGDFDGDGNVDLDDFVILKNNFGV